LVFKSMGVAIEAAHNAWMASWAVIGRFLRPGFDAREDDA
jgi:hypothetical protein